MIDTRYPALSRVLSGSLLWRGGVHLYDVMLAAWGNSHTSRLIDRAVQSAATSTITSVVAMAGALALVAQLVIPRYVRSGLPLAWPLIVVAMAIGVALWPKAFTLAWRHSALAGLSRRVTEGGRQSRRSFSEGG